MIGKNLESYPVFPNWVFTGELQLDDAHINDLLNDLNVLKKREAHFGFETEPNKLTKTMFSLSKLLGAVFFDNVSAHFRLPYELKNIESVDAQFLSIKPGSMVNTHVNRHRWYQGAVFLTPPKNGSKIFMDMIDSKYYSSPPGVQEYKHFIEGAPRKLAFWPAHLPWGFTPNEADSNTVVYTTTFIIKR